LENKVFFFKIKKRKKILKTFVEFEQKNLFYKTKANFFIFFLFFFFKNKKNKKNVKNFCGI
jgi:hypothetical protein